MLIEHVDFNLSLNCEDQHPEYLQKWASVLNVNNIGHLTSELEFKVEFWNKKNSLLLKNTEITDSQSN